MWILCVAIQNLRVKDSKLFEEQDFSRTRETCKQILSMIEETEKIKL